MRRTRWLALLLAVAAQMWLLPEAAAQFASFSLSAASVTEGDSGTREMRFTVTASPPPRPGRSARVTFAITGGTASPVEDYVPFAGYPDLPQQVSLLFRSGERVKSFAVQIKGDRIFEPDETVIGSLSGAILGYIATGTATGTIANDDPPPRAEGPGIGDGIDLDATGDDVGTIIFAKETLQTPAGTETFHVVGIPADLQEWMTMRAMVGYPAATAASAIALGSGPAIRVDLNNVEFNGDVTVGPNGDGWFLIYDEEDDAPKTDAQIPRRKVYGGTGTAGGDTRCPGDTCLIVELGSTTAADSDLAADDTIRLNLHANALRIDAEGNGQVRVRHYADTAAAVNADDDDGLRRDTGWVKAVDVARSIATTILPGVPAVADVAAAPRFSNFAPGGRRPLGSITNAVGSGDIYWKATGFGLPHGEPAQVVGLNDVRPERDGGAVVFRDSTGDLGFATFSLHDSEECLATGSTAVAVAAQGDDAGRGTAATMDGARHLCVTPRASGSAAGAPNLPIPVTDIMASATFEPLPNAVFGLPDAQGRVGTIIRNGATVSLTYLTASDRYNQRIVIVNRGRVPAEYELTDFYTEDGTMATGGDAAAGEVAGESRAVILTREAVLFAGSRTRGGATMAVTGPASLIDVATIQVNLSDGSTDTVTYQVQRSDAEAVATVIP